MTNEYKALMKAANHMDWIQPVRHAGQPCFHLQEDGSFCGRADRWEGHADRSDYPYHRFVSLADLIARPYDELERVKAERDELQANLRHIAFTYCGLKRDKELLLQCCSFDANGDPVKLGSTLYLYPNKDTTREPMQLTVKKAVPYCWYNTIEAARDAARKEGAK